MKTPDVSAIDELRIALPTQFSSIMEREVPSLVEEIVGDIRDTIPEYDRSLHGPYDQVLRSGVEQCVTGFVEWLATPTPALGRRDDVCRNLGRFEAYEGRQLDALQSAYQIGALTGWRRVVALHRQYDLDPAAISGLAEALFTYLEDLAAISMAGYLEATAETSAETQERRRRLLHLIVDRLPAPRDAVADQAEAADWAVPETVTLVALESGAAPVRTSLDGDVLVDLDGNEPFLLVPGPLHPTRRAMLDAVLSESPPAAAGITVPLTRAADSLRWARLLLKLVREGVIDDGRLALCEDHLVTLCLQSDRALIDQMARRRFAPIAGLTKHRQSLLIETLRVWLRTRGPATRIGEDLGVHPQTVRYRMRQIEHAFGTELSDPDVRFATEVVLREQWVRARGRREEGGPGAPSGADDERSRNDGVMHKIR